METWKEIPGLPDYYQVSDQGRVATLKHGFRAYRPEKTKRVITKFVLNASVTKYIGWLPWHLFRIRTVCHKSTIKTKSRRTTGPKIWNGVRQNTTSILVLVLNDVRQNVGNLYIALKPGKRLILAPMRAVK